MIQKKYKGILIFSKIHKENDLFIKFLSESDEVISGIVYGGQSKKKRNIFQVGFYLNFTINSKINKPNSINAELREPFITNILFDKYKLSCLINLSSLINLSIIEGQILNNIYTTVDDFLLILFNKKKWLNKYFIFLFELLKIIGYQIDLSKTESNKYFNLDSLEFTDINSKFCVKFPYFFLHNNKPDINSINMIFKIFENVFIKHHLSNFNLQLPNQYHLFKKLIVERIQQNEKHNK